MQHQKSLKSSFNSRTSEIGRPEVFEVYYAESFSLFWSCLLSWEICHLTKSECKRTIVSLYCSLGRYSGVRYTISNIYDLRNNWKSIEPYSVSSSIWCVFCDSCQMECCGLICHDPASIQIPGTYFLEDCITFVCFIGGQVMWTKSWNDID